MLKVSEYFYQTVCIILKVPYWNYPPVSVMLEVNDWKYLTVRVILKASVKIIWLKVLPWLCLIKNLWLLMLCWKYLIERNWPKVFDWKVITVIFSLHCSDPGPTVKGSCAYVYFTSFIVLLKKYWVQALSSEYNLTKLNLQFGCTSYDLAS